jgi:hypothetical protein
MHVQTQTPEKGQAFEIAYFQLPIKMNGAQ